VSSGAFGEESGSFRGSFSAADYRRVAAETFYETEKLM